MIYEELYKKRNPSLFRAGLILQCLCIWGIIYGVMHQNWYWIIVSLTQSVVCSLGYLFRVYLTYLEGSDD